jgi:acyl-CoA thioesterase
VYDRDGHLVASTAQEGMIRVAADDAAGAKAAP